MHCYQKDPMFNSLLRRRATIACGFDHWLARTRAKAAAAQAETDAGMERLKAALEARGYRVTVLSAGTPDLYDCSGLFDNTAYAAGLRFEDAGEAFSFLEDVSRALIYLDGPGTADVHLKARPPSPGVDVRLNPWLLGVAARHLEQAHQRSGNAVTQESA